MKINEIITERIGPHNMREVELLLAGEKPMAIIHDKSDKKRLLPAIRTGKLVKMNAPRLGWIVARKDHAQYLQTMYDRLNKIKHMEEFDMDEYHRWMGKMLGYSQEDIDFFVNRQQEKRNL